MTASLPDIEAFIRGNIKLADNVWNELGGTESHYHIGNITLTVRHIGDTLLNTVGPALEHALVAVPAADCDGVVYTMDATVLQRAKPPAEWPFATDTHQGHQRIHWDASAGLALNSDEIRGVWQLYDLHSRTGLYWVSDERTLPAWEPGSPLRIFIHWLALQTGNQLLHAAGLQWRDTGILLTGPGGSGKSTTTVAAILDGWKTIGDDFVLLADPMRPVASCLYDTIKLTEQSLEMIRDLRDKVEFLPTTIKEKARLHLGSNFRSQLLRDLPVRFVFALQITNTNTTRIVPASRVQIMTALAPTTMFMLKTGMQESFRNMTILVKQLHCYQILLGTDPHEAIDCLADFLDGKPG